MLSCRYVLLSSLAGATIIQSQELTGDAFAQASARLHMWAAAAA